MSRKGKSGLSGGFESLGLKVETDIDTSLFNFFDTRYGSYAKQLAQDVYEYADEDQTIVSYTEGRNKAYAVIDPSTDSLDALISTGGGTGTKLLSRVMQSQQNQGKGLMWMTDNKESANYYNSIGLSKYRNSNGWYEIKPSEMKDAIKMINKRVKK